MELVAALTNKLRSSLIIHLSSVALAMRLTLCGGVQLSYAFFAKATTLEWSTVDIAKVFVTDGKRIIARRYIKGVFMLAAFMKLDCAILILFSYLQIGL